MALASHGPEKEEEGMVATQSTFLVGVLVVVVVRMDALVLLMAHNEKGQGMMDVAAAGFAGGAVVVDVVSVVVAVVAAELSREKG